MQLQHLWTLLFQAPLFWHAALMWLHCMHWVLTLSLTYSKWNSLQSRCVVYGLRQDNFCLLWTIRIAWIYIWVYFLRYLTDHLESIQYLDLVRKHSIALPANSVRRIHLQTVVTLLLKPIGSGYFGKKNLHQINVLVVKLDSYAIFIIKNIIERIHEALES